MRWLFSGDPLVNEIMISETASHGTSAWDYLLLGAVSLCLEQQLEPTDLVPGGYAKAVGTAEGTWRSCERLGLTRQGR